jgi:TonB-linked SusC/RagA family outer membrane protein
MTRTKPVFRSTLVRFAMAIGLWLTPAAAFAQSAVITGTVKSDAQLPVAGAVIRVQQLNLIAVTNDQGIYRLTVPADRISTQPVTLMVSSIGFRNAQASITLQPGSNTRDFVLATQAVELEQVVVTGTAGRLERRAQAAQIAQVNVSQVAQIAPVTSVMNVLQARTPGVVLRNESGTTGTATTIRVRGLTSIDLSNDPLVFIDGVRVSAQNTNIYAVGNQERSRLNDLKLDEIESIELVKGPAAAALYGSDANAGVINIITKRGRSQSGFTQSITLEYGQSAPNFDPPDNYARCVQGNATNAVFPACASVPVGTVLIDNPLQRTQPFQDGRYRNFSWNLRGGTEKHTVFLIVGADDDDGTLPHNEFSHINGRANFGFLPTEKLHLDIGFGIARVMSDLPRNDNDIYGYLGGGFLGDPRTVGGAKDGWFGNNRQVTAISSYENLDKNLRINPRISASYTPVDWFTNRFTFGGDITRTRAYSFWAKNDIGWFDDAPRNTGQIGEARESRDRFTLDYLGNITQMLPFLNVRTDLSFGMQALTNKFDRVDATGLGLVNNEVRTVSAASRLAGGGQTSSESRQIGFFGQAQFSLWERLYPKVALRRDQSSSFGAESKAFYSPSFGVSYVISDEPFFRNVTDFLPEEFLNTLRLRAAWGVAGRHPTEGARSVFSPSTNQITATAVAVGVRPGQVGNPEIRAEKTREIELGFEAALLNDRLGFDVLYYHKKTTDGILELPVPPSQGIAGNDRPLVNIGALQNKGWEVAVNARPITHRNVALDVRLTGATLENKLLDLGCEKDSEGRFVTNDQGRYICDVPESATRKIGFPLTGVWDEVIRSIDVASNRVIVSDTLELLGYSPTYPKISGTASATLTLFGNLSFYALADARGGTIQFNNTDQFRDRSNGFTAPAVLGPAAFGTNPDGTPTDEAKVKWMELFGCIPPNYGQPNQGTCPAWVTETYVDRQGVQRGGRTLSRGTVGGGYNQDADFIKLREVSATYRVPNRFAQQFLRAQTAAVTLSFRNLYMWSNYGGFDPESLNFLAVPQDKRWTVRFNVTF